MNRDPRPASCTGRCRRFVAGMVMALAVLMLAQCSFLDDNNSNNGAGSVADPAQPETERVFDDSVEATSPSGDVTIEAGVDRDGRATYRILRGDTEVVEMSTLGLETSLGSIARNLTIDQRTEAETVTDSFDLPTGKARRSEITATTRSVRFITPDAEGVAMWVDLWASDRGAAFRYRLADLDAPDQAATVTLNWERTSFALPEDSSAWLQPHDPPTMWTPSYESFWGRRVAADSPGSSAQGWTFPALFRTEEAWLLVTESALAEGDHGSHFSPVVEAGEYLLDQPDPDEGNGVGADFPEVDLPWTSPWRVVIVGDHLGEIVASNLVRHLSPGTSDDFGWVEPGRVSWSWWSDHESPQDIDKMKPFVELAAEFGWEYSLVDANWTENTDEAMLELLDFAAERNVQLLLWLNSGGPHNAVTEAPRDLMADPETRRRELARIAELGFAGVKVDFFHSDKPEVIQLYRDILTDTADLGLLANFHGATVPRGWSREFPHLMTVEAVRGAEFYTFDGSYQREAARNNTVLAFTRNVVGSMDYTPVIVGDTVARRTTDGHELALGVVFESALQHLADTPDAYRSLPEPVQVLLSDLPTVWDEVRLLDGFPGSHVALARRHGDEWWVGVINGTSEEMTVRLDLSRLGATGGEVTLVCDDATVGVGGEPDLITTSHRSDDTVAVDLLPNGGCIGAIAS